MPPAGVLLTSGRSKANVCSSRSTTGKKALELLLPDRGRGRDGELVGRTLHLQGNEGCLLEVGESRTSRGVSTPIEAAEAEA